MSARRAVFLDVDGTLVNEVGEVPDSARAAIREARARGHRMFLATGRSPAELWPELWDLGFDGIIGAAGAYVAVGDEVLVYRSIPRATLRHAHDFFAAYAVDAYYQSHHAIYARAGVRDRLRAMLVASAGDPTVLERGPFRFVDAVDTETDPLAADVTKVIFVRAPLSIDRLRAEFADEFDIISSTVSLFGTSSGEMMIPGVHKASGIDVLTAHLGIDRADTIALGDSHNDLEMLAHVGVGIAMGDAAPSVREVADEVTGTADGHGVRDAFRRHGLIG